MYNLGGSRNVSNKYPVMSYTQIANLDIPSITDKDCVLFMWITYPHLNKVFYVIEQWGFEYKTVAFTWVKRNKKAPTYFMGLGNWTRANAEVCLLAVKGKPKRVSKSVRQIVDEPIEAHSKKPDIVRDRIVELMGDVPRIELFARQKTKGWHAWGNEIESDIKL